MTKTDFSTQNNYFEEEFAAFPTSQPLLSTSIEQT